MGKGQRLVGLREGGGRVEARRVVSMEGSTVTQAKDNGGLVQEVEKKICLQSCVK